MKPLHYDKVLVYAHHAPPQPSASATRMVSLARHLRAQGVTVKFLTTKLGPTCYDGFPIERCDGRRGLFRALRLHPRCPILVSSPPATPAAEAAIFARMLGYRVIVDIRDPFVSEALKNGDLAPGFSTGAKLLLERSLFYSAHVLCYVSEALQKLMEERFGRPNCLRVIAPNGVDRNVFNLKEEARREHRQALGFGDGAVFTYVGILGGKSLDQAFEALAPALSKGAKLLMIVVLDEYSRPIYEALQAQARHLGVAEQIIWRFNLTPEQVASYLNAADIGLNPLPFNRSYCLPVKTFEFLACGVLPLNIVGKDNALLNLFSEDGLATFCFSWDECRESACKLVDNIQEVRARTVARAASAEEFDREDANAVLADVLMDRSQA